MGPSADIGVIFSFLGAGLFILLAVSWIAFARLSMTGIERRLKDSGIGRPCPWDGIGYRALWYAWAISVPIGIFNPHNDPSIDVPVVREYSTSFDRTLARIFIISAVVATIFILGGGLLLDIQ